MVTQDLRVPFGRAPAAGLGAQLTLLMLLWAAGVCLGFAGWLAGTVYAVVMWAVLRSALRRSRTRSFGPANGVTLARATLVGCVTAIVAQTLMERESVTTLIVIAAAALALDAVDGHVARRTRTASPLGARFDMEVDAFLILVLSVFVANSFGAWVLSIGAMRYAFVAAGWAVPWLRASLPGTRAGKTVAAMQGIVLVFAAADVAPRPVAYVAVASALALLCWSFGRDVVWLWRNRHAEVVPPR
ncbi:CDP-alcohol phosphatidyltransferase family protein [Actinoallomurus bryophytorum]|uniref:CDP-alcohol phosphatidyltransferase-like enzyme n=1 Tax=Actinoallomurus bryophytorum TaxID=1490222 RepID=A0A543CPJ2_9ACTN|nr:CDP-alcohol phosphatidyltransferase family protein [Actinoallomurus bryophytorum]TQL99016.1 CDP-alcohol phosphatidyltransferase-like enzyme [Actinoallomurus bryophytorum]